ncbi:MAG: flagellar hook-basal body complex protein FliE [Dehalococcoidia bacterium]|nr:flagellar hook-basal body complex protein FliE [Dehalococcoidia bacterium]
MAIPGIGGLSSTGAFGAGGIGAGGNIGQVVGAPTDPGAASGNSFQQMLDALSGVSAEADGAVADLATGGERDLHDVVLSVEMESLAFDLAVQIRNRLVEAYSEVFRMQV